VNNSVDKEIEIIARRIRGWRAEDKLTLQELAERSGVATSTIQKIETGQMMPSVAVLLKVARGLGRPISDLVRDDSAVTDIVHLRSHERQPICLGSNLLVEQLTGELHKPGIEMWRVTLHPRNGLGSSSDAISYEGEELVVCELGAVVFRVGDQSHRLEAGDTLHFKASIPHSWHNDGKNSTQFTITSTVPLTFRALMQSQAANAAGGQQPEPRLTAISA
jgi:transcriptional regulator with XRE-family HTH domain